MKEKALVTPNPSWPAGVPFFGPAREPQSRSTTPRQRHASVGPIELRIDSAAGPSAIAILE